MNILTDNFSEPLNGSTVAQFDINAGDGNLAIDRFTDGKQVLASGTLEYLEKQGLPARTLNSSNGQTVLSLICGSDGQPWFRLPWAACNGATEWQIKLNPTISSDITAHSDGGNVKLDLSGMVITHVSADTGGGNMDMTLPDNAANLSITAKSGAGNVTIEFGSGLRGSSVLSAESGAGNVAVCIPGSVAARIHATTGLGKVTVDPQFGKLDDTTYQSPDFDSAINKIEITLKSGMGDVIVSTR